MLIFEHPLNERMRALLKVEYLLNQLHLFEVIDNFNKALAFFHLMNDLLDILERVDIRTELQKELEAQQQKMMAWRDVAGIDRTRLNQITNQISTIYSQVANADRFGKILREDRIISAVRRRITIPAGYFTFDLPIFHMWLNTAQGDRNRQVSHWLRELSLLTKTVSIYMQLVRQNGQFQTYQCSGLFHRDNFGEVELLRVRIPARHAIYPQISGNQTRFAIRFMPYDESRTIHSIEFELTCC